ncbi:MAG: hypothetical protein PHV74_05975 [Dehalococcoidia bacterium]|nr:hypothetical protein [Dehalococcoidia bacterium]
MKRFFLMSMAILISMALMVSACSSGSDSGTLKTQNAALTAENAAQKVDLESAKTNLDSLEAEYDSLKTGYEEVEAKRDSLQSEYEAIKVQQDFLQPKYDKAIRDLATLEADYQSLLKRAEQSSLRNPTWQELRTFISADETDTYPYSADQFDCSGFAITLRDNASNYGFRSAYVELGFASESTGHALDAFQTTDKGLVYVDNTERDQIAYVEKDKIYGVIILAGVKETFIDCNMKPDEFWKPLTNARYTGNLFGYGYYQNYSQRSQFYRDSVDAYNHDVEAYNAVIKQGTGYSEILSWGNRLKDWFPNLDALWKDLGSSYVKPMGAVSTIETYWN